MDIKMKLTAAAMAALAMGGAGCASTGGGMVAPRDSGSSTGAAPVTAPSSDAKGECWGVNACKGQGACGGVGHECAGQNACKGQGWLSLSKSECDGKNGKFKAG